MSMTDWLLFAYCTCLHIITWWQVQKMFDVAEEEEDPDKTFTEIGATHLVKDLEEHRKISCDGKGRIAEFKDKNGETFVAVIVPKKSWTRKLRNEIGEGRYDETDEEENSNDNECN